MPVNVEPLVARGIQVRKGIVGILLSLLVLAAGCGPMPAAKETEPSMTSGNRAPQDAQVTWMLGMYVGGGRRFASVFVKNIDDGTALNVSVAVENANGDLLHVMDELGPVDRIKPEYRHLPTVVQAWQPGERYWFVADPDTFIHIAEKGDSVDTPGPYPKRIVVCWSQPGSQEEHEYVFTLPQGHPATPCLVTITPPQGVVRPTVTEEQIAGASAPEELRKDLEAVVDGSRRTPGSPFSNKTAGAIKRVAVIDDVVVVDLYDVREALPGANDDRTAGGLLFALAHPVFRYSVDTQQLVLQFEGSCDRFWSWLGADCRSYTRDLWENAARSILPETQ